jgi:recombination protein RecA
MALNRSKGLDNLLKNEMPGSFFVPTQQIDYSVGVISTGADTLDAALGGGWMRGHQHMVMGEYSAGKSSLVNSAIGRLLSFDDKALACIVDIEGSVTPQWLEKFDGVDFDYDNPRNNRVWVSTPDTVENAANSLSAIIREGIFDLIVVDSLGAVARGVEVDGKKGDGGDANAMQVAGSAGVITRMVNRVNSELTRISNQKRAGSDVVLPVILYIGQARINLKSPHGGLIISGGEGLKHMCKTITEIRASGKADDIKWADVHGERVKVGTRVITKNRKNKLAAPYREAGYMFYYVETEQYPFGVDSADSLVDLAIGYGVVKSSGSWLSYGTEGEKGFVKAQGKAKFSEFLRDNPEFAKTVHDETMAVVIGESEGYLKIAEPGDGEFKE